jgi:hypothetical protein
VAKDTIMASVTAAQSNTAMDALTSEQLSLVEDSSDYGVALVDEHHRCKGRPVLALTDSGACHETAHDAES